MNDKKKVVMIGRCSGMSHAVAECIARMHVEGKGEVVGEGDRRFLPPLDRLGDILGKVERKAKEMADEKWTVETFQSGTHIVTRSNGKPHLYVYGDERFKVCEQLRDFLNDGVEPPWLDKLERNLPFFPGFTGPDGIHVTATGPMFDQRPPTLWWAQVETEEAKQDRLELIARFFGGLIA